MIENFHQTGLSEELMQAVAELGFEKPTEIQGLAIPLLLENRGDLIGLAQTGTGKTAAFGLPMLQYTDFSVRAIQSLIVCPTRELCLQITRDLEKFSKHLPSPSITSVYGGASIQEQHRQLKRGAHIVVATPGRMVDLLDRGWIDLSQVTTVVLDEADEMLNMGFKEDLDRILSEVPDGRQTWLFSATMLPGVRRIAGNYMSNPREVSTGKANRSAENIEHLYYVVHARDRYPALRRIVDASPGIYGMIFCRTRMETQEVASHLIRDGYPADSLHGDLSQQQREAVMHRFRSKQSTILVATDVAARGIDISDITHVIHYQIPDDIENYTHRSGRTARAGKSGVSIALVNTREVNRVKDIERQIGKKLAYRAVPNGKEICMSQLMHLVDKISATEAMAEEISDYLPEVMERLDGLSKEDLITRMLSAEFSRFLDHYRNSPDLNVNPDHMRKKAGEKNFREHGRDRDRGFEGRSKWSSGDDRRQGRDDRRSSRDDQGGERRRERRAPDASDPRADGRLFLNLGSMDGFDPDTFRQWVSSVSGINEYDVKRIKLKDSFTFFEVEKPELGRVISAFSGKKFKGRKLRIDHASN